MIVLPNYFERYLSSLRISVSLSVLKHGLKRRHIENFKKIYKAEALYHKNSINSVDINKLCNNLLEAVACIKADFNFSCKASGNYCINKNLLICLLLKAAKIGNLKIKLVNNFLSIKFSGENIALSPFVSALGGFSLKELKTMQNLIIIPVTPTAQESIQIETTWDYLFDKFSPVNLFLQDDKL